MSRLKHLRLLLDCLIKFPGEGLYVFRKVFWNTKGSEIVAQLGDFKHPIFIRNGTTDREVFGQIFLRDQYSFSRHVSNREVKVVIDGGSNIGMSVLYFLKRYPEAHIYAVELETSNYQQLVKNTKHYKQVTAINAGLWGKSTQLVVENMDADKWMFHAAEGVRNHLNKQKSNLIAGVTINELVVQYNLQRIDILKLDVEGAERQIFCGNTNFLKLTELLIIELHDYRVEYCTKALFKALENYAYRLFTNGENLVIEMLHEQMPSV